MREYENPTCPLCGWTIAGNETRVDTYKRDEGGNVIDRKPVHLECLLHPEYRNS